MKPNIDNQGEVPRARLLSQLVAVTRVIWYSQPGNQIIHRAHTTLPPPLEGVRTGARYGTGLFFATPRAAEPPQRVLGRAELVEAA